MKEREGRERSRRGEEEGVEAGFDKERSAGDGGGCRSGVESSNEEYRVAERVEKESDVAALVLR